MTMPLLLVAEDTVELHELSVTVDGPDQFCVGDPASGEFVSLPPEGVYLIEAFSAGRSVAEISKSFQDRFGEAPDIPAFVSGLIEVGFVQRVGIHDLASTPQRGRGIVLLGGLSARQCRWLLSPAVTTLTLAAWVAVPLLLMFGRIPQANDALAYPNVLILLAVFVPVAWALLCLHELAHSLVARALGCPAYTRFGNRLWNLVCETDLSSIYSLPRRRRLRPLLAGMSFDIIVLDVCIAMELTHIGGRPPYVIAYMLTSTLVFQTGIFLRTDLYYVLTNVLRLDNLVPHARAEVAYRLRRVGFGRLRGREPVKPSLSRRERWMVRLYLLGCLVGIGLGALTVVNLIIPASRGVIGIAVKHMGNGPIDPQFWAGLFVVAFFTFVYSVLTWTFIRNRRDAVRAKSATRIVASS